jgi:hypothetical protein
MKPMSDLRTPERSAVFDLVVKCLIAYGGAALAFNLNALIGNSLSLGLFLLMVCLLPFFWLVFKNGASILWYYFGVFASYTCWIVTMSVLHVTTTEPSQASNLILAISIVFGAFIVRFAKWRTRGWYPSLFR